MGVRLRPDGKNPLAIPTNLLRFPLLLFLVVEDEERALLEAEAIQVIGQLVEAIFVGLLAAPEFEFDHVLVLVVRDEDVQAFFFRDLRLFESVAVAIEDGFEEGQKDQAALAFQEITFLFVVFRFHQLLKLQEGFGHVEVLAG